MKTFEFKKEPGFAELFDLCVYELEYNPKSIYLGSLKDFFKENNITKKSKIIDVCAGTGFPSLDLLKEGYSFDCLDASDDEINLFHKKAKKSELKIKCEKQKWLEIPIEKNDFYKLVLCRGNSFIYAAGGWNEEIKINKKESLKLYEKTLKKFYGLLKQGGILYLDKFKDNETNGKELVGKIKINNENKNLFFFHEIKGDERRAAMLIEDGSGNSKGLPNITYNLSEFELKELLKKVGFKNIKKINLYGETHFDIFIAKK
jgi:ubiquinone/menaquinone biosynthesis C-methylase UbiE